MPRTRAIKPAPTAVAGLVVWARQRAGLTQKQLAERAGMAQAQIAGYEDGKRVPRVDALERLLAAAGFELRMSLAPIDPTEPGRTYPPSRRPAPHREERPATVIE